jgi:UDP-N-acetylmuramate--alanine ligase
MAKIYLSGIAGSGLSAIACYLAENGNKIWGSDRCFDIDKGHPLFEPLLSKGIKIVAQDGNALDNSFDLIIFSTAVESSNPEYLKALSLGIPIKTRPEYLIELTEKKCSIAVSGTSGKSTTAGMLAFLLNELSMDSDFIGGGRVKNFKKINGIGNYLAKSGNLLVLEACESDETIIKYKPYYTILLNLDFDHHSIEKTAYMFQILSDNTSEKIIINKDDQNLRKIKVKNPIYFSIDSQSDFKAEHVILNPFYTEFTLKGIKFVLNLPGRHNLYNALACISILCYMGFSLNSISEILPYFDGLERRFDVVLMEKDYLVIDDYAHNPHKIDSLMDTVMRLSPSICYIFQPHGYGPTRLLKDEYIRVFSKRLRDSDHLIILPIFYQGGTVQMDISSHVLKEGVKSFKRSVEVVEDREEIIKKIKNFNTFVIFGARDESLAQFAKRLAKSISSRK